MALPYDRLVERWVLFLHLAAVLGFMLAHGVQVTVMWRIRSESDPSDLATKRAAYDAARLSPHPFIVTVVGLGGLGVILWLMVFKPF